MLDDWSVWEVVILGAGVSGGIAFVLSMVTLVTELDDKISYAERLALVDGLPAIALGCVLLLSPHFTGAMSVMAVLIALAVIVGTDILADVFQSRLS